ncbi:MAG TPA: cation-translocating P-type ATPase [Candidatus Egerieicola faecale]|uniref:Cation-translocating P-type ATPase n=1 Tax=Candidatus Egerieicola faecale TaxID=2840774 RepID=A0A9D1IUE3_9FIRM|nr:cation-translocating P-type ATPase [Candidatus Egerieicola faecale]
MGVTSLLQADLRDAGQPVNGKPNPEGLSASQVKKQQKKYGPNTLPPPPKRSGAALFFGQYKDLLTLILLAATAVSLLLGEWMDAVTIGIIVLCNGILGFIQEFRTEKTLEALQALSAPTAQVLREGVPMTVPAQEVTVGDILLLEAGCRVAADGVVLESIGLSAEESLLTGEAEAVSKQAADLPYPENELHQPGRVYMGSTIAAGRGRALVTHIGSHTQMGAIAGMLKQTQSPPTPLQQRLSKLGRWIALGCVGICGAVSLIGLIRGEDPLSMLLTGLSLAVAAVPEGLPAIVTISLAIAVKRMVKQNALVRKLPSVETLGTVNVICTDKTGTLTQNKMKVTHLYDLSEIRSLDAPLAPAGKELIGKTAACLNVAQTKEGFQGDPTETALAECAQTLGIYFPGQRLGEIPFDSKRRRMTVAQFWEGRRILITKGAPEAVIPYCTRWGGEETPFTERDRRAVFAAAEAMSQKGLRVLAAAWRPQQEGELGEQDLILLGLVGLSDPPRPEVKQAVEDCRTGGIRTVMITGDHALTAKAIAAQVGIDQNAKPITGQKLERMDDASLEEAVKTATVFARVTPAHKLRIVKALQKSGSRVAMTGDGVNDAPAVKQAEVGVAMGQGGTDVTRQAADLVLLDDNFATLAKAVKEGRVIYQNIRKFIRYLISCNIGEVCCMLFSMLMGWPVVLLPIQILFVNLLTDGLPAMALGLDPAEDGVMHRPPRNPKEGVFSDGLGFTVAVRGVAIALSTLASFSVLWGQTGDLTLARTGALFTLIFTQLMNVFECKSETLPFWKIHLGNNKKLILAALSSLTCLILVMALPVFQGIFHTGMLPLTGLFCCIGISFLPTLLGLLTRRRGKK